MTEAQPFSEADLEETKIWADRQDFVARTRFHTLLDAYKTADALKAKVSELEEVIGANETQLDEQAKEIEVLKDRIDILEERLEPKKQRKVRGRV